MKIFAIVFLSCLNFLHFSSARQYFYCDDDYETKNDCIENVCIKRCDQLGYEQDCTEIDKADCSIGCICEVGYLRDNHGACVDIETCPFCGGDYNATRGCGTYCKESCTDYNNKDKVCGFGCSFNACKCKKGYVHDAKHDECVLPKDCDVNECGKHEQWVNCIQKVCLDRCDQVGYPVVCETGECSPGCVCYSGYLRNKRGKCIKVADCPSCKGDYNATQGCGNYCKQSCTDYNNKDKVCKIGCIYNACICKKGYVYDAKNDRCVLPKDCDVNECGKHEQWVDCIQKICLSRCDQVGYPDVCDTGECSPGCVCQTGYVRNKRGKCIKSADCPSCRADPNAEQGCGSYCGQSCTDYMEKNKVCPLGCIYNGCKCRKGFVYDAPLKKCVRPEDCT